MNTEVSKHIRSGLLAAAIAALMTPATALSALDSRDFVVPIVKSSAKRSPALTRPATPTPLRKPADVVVVTGPAGEAGYVHYFVITGPDGEPETQVGIELEDGRIVWSFPEAGVFVAPFLAAGSFTIGQNRYDIEHLYGLRPFRTAAAMSTLARELATRIAPFVADKTPYCDESGSADYFCVSCLGFVLRVLYPANTGIYPALPADFRSARKGMYSTEDLLLYLTGIPVDATRAARARRIEALGVPESLREELTRISSGLEPVAPRVAAAKPRRATQPKARAAVHPVETSRRAPGRRS
jgi:hypothetical protein